MRTSTSRRLGLWSLMLVMLITAWSAQSVRLKAEDQYVIPLRAGEMLEIASDAGSPEAQFSWILTRDRRFISGQRTRFFQTRFAEPGTYTLDVSIQDSTTGENVLRTFTVIVSEPDGNLPSLPEDTKTQPLSAVFTSDPPSINGILYVPPAGGIVRISASASRGAIEKYVIDLDTSIDSDKDGDPANDRDNQNTLSEKTGSPIYYFIVPKPIARSIRLTVNDLSGASPSMIEHQISFGTPPASVGSASAPSFQSLNGPISIRQDGLSITAEARFDDPSIEGKQLLYEWDFGDRSRSLLSRPDHRYNVGGTYVITLTVRDIASGEIVENVSATAEVSDAGGSSSVTSSEPSSSSSSSSEASTKAQHTTSGGASFMGVFKVLIIILVLLAIAIGLYALLTWIKRRTTTSIQQTLEKMEATIVKTESKEEAPEAPAPLKIKKENAQPDVKPNPSDVSDREKEKSEFRTKERTNETPAAAVGPVPPWLKSGNNAPKATTTPEQKNEAPKTNPAPGPTPAWLQQSNPAPAAASEQKSDASPSPSENAKSAAPQASNTRVPQNAGPVPPWLKQGPKTPPTAQETPKPVQTKQPPTASATPKPEPQSTPPAPEQKSAQNPTVQSQRPSPVPTQKATPVAVAPAQKAPNPTPEAQAKAPPSQPKREPTAPPPAPEKAPTPRTNATQPPKTDTATQPAAAKQQSDDAHGMKSAQPLSGEIPRQESKPPAGASDAPIAIISADSLKP